MKKLAVLFVCAFAFMSCELDDLEPVNQQRFAEVINIDLPESFEEGKVYDIDVTYLLPDACHTAFGLHASRGGQFGDARRDIYVFGVASYDPRVTECDEDDDDLERESSFRLRIDDDEPFTFYLWTGVDDDDENVFTEVEVPVVDPSSQPDTEE